MEWLNYHHLYYFWTVARLGSVTAAAAELRVAQPTVSGQIHALEQSLGRKLFARAGRGLALTPTGETVFRYAGEIFTLGRELQDTLQGRAIGVPARFVVGVSDALPSRVAFRILAPALSLPTPVHLVCRQDRTDRLVADLALHTLDLVLADAPIGPGGPVRAFNHPLGECGVVFAASAELAASHRRRFPRSLDGAPMILPGGNSALRRALEQWFVAQELRPRVVAEIDDSALRKSFAQSGAGIVALPAVAEDELLRHYELARVGATDGVRERFYALSLERRLKHPAVLAICSAARGSLAV